MHLFVPTDAEGVQHLADHRRAWPLPEAGAPGAAARASAGEHLLVLLDEAGLLEVLGERIFLAEPLEDGPAGDELPDGMLAGVAVEASVAAGPPGRMVGAARLVRELPWDLLATATFALDCAEHALGVVEAAGDGREELPDGSTLQDALDEARRYLGSASGGLSPAGGPSPAGDERRLGALARLSLARRLGAEQAKVAGLAFAAVGADVGEDLDVLDDPRWTNLAALSSALLACAEVLRHLALPRYVAARERHFDVDNQDAGGESDPVLVTPWGPITLGGHHPGYVPAYVSAREAAERARQAVGHELGASALAREAGYQRERLVELLGLAG
ncbi:MAG TPA: hypothetical protein VMD59_02165 [Acidimicrobiales bacterium]|nr:hypothetical protein [Acidimicrobiales bacterium]